MSIFSNTNIFGVINQAAGQSATLDLLMLWVTHYVPYFMVALVVVYMVWVYPRRDTYNALHRVGQILEYIVTLTTTFVVVQFIKVALAHPRPFVVLSETILLVPDQAGYSFPSMHTALTVAVAMSVLVHHRRLGKLLLLFALLVGLSRIYVGVHYPVDVLAGGLIGAVIAVLFHKLFSRVAHHTNP